MKYGLFFVALVGLIACCNDRKANKFTYSEQTNHSLQSGDTVIIDSGIIKDMLVATDSNIAMIPYPDSTSIAALGGGLPAKDSKLTGTGMWAGGGHQDDSLNYPSFIYDSISIHPVKKHKKKHKRWDDGMYIGDGPDSAPGDSSGGYDPRPIICDDTTSIKLDSIETKNDSAWRQFCEKMFKQAEDRSSNGWIKIHDKWSGFDWYWYDDYYHWMQGYINDPYFDTRYYDSTFRHYTDSIWHVLYQSQIKPR